MNIHAPPASCLIEKTVANTPSITGAAAGDQIHVDHLQGVAGLS